MILPVLIFALSMQATAARPAAAKASVAGVVVDSSTSEPVSNVRVTLARTDLPLGAFAQAMGGGPPTATTIPAEFIEELIGQMERAVNNGSVTPELTSRSAAFKSLPLADILEVVMAPGGGNAVVLKSAPPEMTDEQGRFSFGDLEPGTYRLIFARNGYAKQDYGQRTLAGSGIPLPLAPGQAKTDVVMRLARVGAISGRIRDTLGQPAVAVPVQLVRSYFDGSGQKQTQRIAATLTDDRGEYRMFYLSPGRYYLSAGSQAGQTRPANLPRGLEDPFSRAGYSSSAAKPQEFALSYYPGSADQNAARPIEVQPGADVQGIDLVVGPQQSYRIRGRVVDPAAGRPPQNVTISKTIETSEPGLMFGGGPDDFRYKAADGTFEMQHVGPGTYTITAGVQDRLTGFSPGPDFANMTPAERDAFFEADMNAERARPRAMARIAVTNADIEGVVMTMTTSGSLSGGFRIDSTAPNAALELSMLRVQLGGAPVSGNINNIVNYRGVSADGTFRIDNLLPDEYRLSVASLPQGFYVKEARLGDTDVLTNPLVFSRSDRALNILLSPNVGAVNGAVLDVTGQPVSGAQVVLIPTRNRERTELFRSVTADSKGLFTISSVAPGEYTLAAWETMEPYAFFAPEEIARALASGKTVNVKESSTQTADVIAIPAPSR